MTCAPSELESSRLFAIAAIESPETMTVRSVSAGPPVTSIMVTWSSTRTWSEATTRSSTASFGFSGAAARDEKLPKQIAGEN